MWRRGEEEEGKDEEEGEEEEERGKEKRRGGVKERRTRRRRLGGPCSGNLLRSGRGPQPPPHPPLRMPQTQTALILSHASGVSHFFLAS